MNKDHRLLLLVTNHVSTCSDNNRIETVIKYMIHFLRLLRWEEDSHQSILLLLIWTLFCFHSQLCILYLFPITLILSRQFRFQKDDSLIQQDSLLEELSLTLLPFVKYYQQLSLSIRKHHHSRGQLYYLFFFILSYLIWRISLSIMGFNKLIWFIGSFILSWHSSFMKIMIHHIHANHIVSQSCNSILMNHEYHQQEYHYQFKVIEHQRWWLFKGWCSLLLKNERPSWSDEYLERVPCIQKFRLPSPVTKIIDNEKIMINSWEWSSQEWRIDKQRNVDKEGWEYGVWGWNAWISRPSSFCSFTRRRYWVRNACLVTKINNDHYVTTMENGSIKPSSTNYINTQMTPSNPNSINANKYNQQLRPSSSQSTVTSTNNVPSLSSASLSNTASSSEEEEEEEEIGILLMTPTTVTVSTSQFDYKKSFVHHHHQKLSTPLTTSNKSTQSNRIKRSASRNSAIENHFWLYR